MNAKGIASEEEQIVYKVRPSMIAGKIDQVKKLWQVVDYLKKKTAAAQQNVEYGKTQEGMQGYRPKTDCTMMWLI